MKKLSEILKALQMLGVFGFILIMALIIIAISTYNIFLIDEGIVGVRANIAKEILLENIEHDLINEELAELAYILHADQSAITAFQESQESLEGHLTALAAVDEKESGIATIRQDQEEMEAGFAEIVDLVDEGTLTVERLDEILLSEEAIIEELENMVFEGEIELAESVREVQQRNQQAIFLGLVGLALFPFLAVWAFFVASHITIPKLRIANAIISLGGGRYREELLEEFLERRDNMGEFARTIHEMAISSSARTAALNAELAELEKGLSKVRKNRLTLTTLNQTKDR